MAKDTFDPRFDPAFQPGFDGATTPVGGPVKKTAAQVALERRTPDLIGARPPAPSSPTAVASGETGAVPHPPAEEEGDTVRRPNPFLIALAAISIALIVGGLGSAQSIRSLFQTENISVDLDYISLEMLKFAAPLAVALGVATGIGVLFMYAIDWKKRHGG